MMKLLHHYTRIDLRTNAIRRITDFPDGNRNSCSRLHLDKCHPRLAAISNALPVLGCKEDRLMHDFTLVLAFVAVAFLAYQGELDDRPAAQDEDWVQLHHIE
jgi:hypothetical protein